MGDTELVFRLLEVLRHPYVKNGEAIGKILESCGEAVEALGVDERATLTNMAAEIGAFTGLVAPDERTVEWLVERRGMSADEARALTQGLQSDEGNMAFTARSQPIDKRGLGAIAESSVNYAVNGVLVSGLLFANLDHQ